VQKDQAMNDRYFNFEFFMTVLFIVVMLALQTFSPYGG